jgi:hypothetical protein
MMGKIDNPPRTPRSVGVNIHSPSLYVVSLVDPGGVKVMII